LFISEIFHLVAGNVLLLVMKTMASETMDKQELVCDNNNPKDIHSE
jgi:hypothetical protein